MVEALYYHNMAFDGHRAMLELNQILRANEINFAVLAALPALLFAIAVGWLLRRPFIKVGGCPQCCLPFLDCTLCICEVDSP